ncbi:GrpE, mitochondrial [Tritrichomonas musculus]|uniref:GrpE protein homolog n=1 Tax=Tritrichomonas musculus TaxID=1915356 RepID=A0ABR2K3K7_9EUKA
MISQLSSLASFPIKSTFVRSFAQAASQTIQEENSIKSTETTQGIDDLLKSKQNTKVEEQKNTQNPETKEKPAAEENKKEEIPKPTYEQLENEVNDLKNRNLYLLADVENSRRRFERLARELETTAVVSIAKQLLPVADNIKRIQESGEKQTVASILEAVGIIDSELHSIFKAFKIIRLSSKGQKFNPEFHDAIATVPNPNGESGTVMDVINEGYTIDGKLLRAAKVVVVK